MNDVPDEVMDAISEHVREMRVEGLDSNSEFSRDLIEAAYDETPLMGTKGGCAIDTRLMVIREYVQSRGQQAKRGGGGGIRSEEKARLDRVFNRIASVTDRSESAIKKQCVHSVYSGENQTEQFLNDLRGVEERLKAGSREETGSK